MKTNRIQGRKALLVLSTILMPLLASANVKGFTDSQYGIDVTNLLENPDFENSAAGWNIVGGNKIAATAATYGYSGTNFIENWVAAPGTLGDQSWSQTIEVPNGVYAIKSMAHAVLESDASVVPSGVAIYANKDEVAVTTTHTNPPAEYSLVTVVTDGKLTIGYRITNCNINWAAWDNVRVIRYDAETTNDGLVMYAKDEMNILRIKAEELTTCKFQLLLLNNLEYSISNIDKVSSWPEAKSLWDTLKTLIIEAEQSILAYEKLKEKIDYAHTWQTKGYEIDVEAFNYEVNKVENAYETGILNVEETKDAITILNDALLNFFTHNNHYEEEALDVSDMFIENPTLRKGSEGWEGSEPNLGHEVMEFFRCDFDMYQELKGLPSGRYVLSVQGFYDTNSRKKDDLPYKLGNENITGELYANEESTPFISIYKYTASEMGITSEGVFKDYVHMRISANEAFNRINPILDIPYYSENSVEVYIYDGKLKIGLRDEVLNPNSWCVFRDFKLEYYGIETVTYLVDGEIYKTDTIKKGEPIPLIDVPRKEGHSFMGWKDAPTVMPGRDIVIEGGFNYQVTFKIDDEVIKSDSIEYGERIPLPDVVEKEGYTFNGWNAPETMPAEDIVLTGTYSINSYSLKYIVDGEVYHQSTVAYGGTITPPMELPVKEGHTFVGWSNLPSTMPASDVEVEAIFTTNKYCITYVIDNTVIAMDSISYGDDIILMDPPTREGFTFAGWSYVPEKMPATDIMVIGVYTTNSYLLTYLVDGEVYESGIVECGSAITPPEIPSKEGYTFSGWNNIPEVMPANELVITGTFVANKYLVTFMIDDQIIASDSLDYGTMITVPNVPEREGYSFSGWGEVAETVPANDVTYEGHYSVNSYKLTYTVDGEIVLGESVAYGTALTLLAEPTKEGYTFSGWSEVPETMPAEDVVVSGTFTINEYLVTFTVDGVAIASDSLAYGTAIIIPTMPEREGYTFSGWSEVDATVPAHDVTYDASYTANIYKVYYFVGATLVHTAEVAYGEAIPEYVYEPTVEGDVFMGWIGETYETMPAHDVTYMANITNDVLQLTIDNSKLTIYNLCGRKIEVGDLRELCEGIYIINGQKVVINNK